MYIKTPINYTGNKYQILDQILNKMDTEGKVVTDLCSGGGTVGFNITDAKKIYLIEKNKKVVDLLKFIGNSSESEFIKKVNILISEYNLSNSSLYGVKYYREFRSGNNGLKDFNKDAFAILRSDYNKLKNKSSNKALIRLYLLIVYGFNNDMRFNKSGEFNIPCGKTDFNSNNMRKIINFQNRYTLGNYEILNMDCFSKEALEICLNSDIIYIDPPYLITLAGYNEANQWTENEEKKLLRLIEKLSSNGKIIYLSNVLESDGKTNDILTDWCEKNKNICTIYEIDKHYRSSSYNKKIRGRNREVLIEVKNENK